MSNNESSSSAEGLTEKYLRGASLVESSPQEALSLLESIQKDVGALSLFSSNETLEDISTKSLPFLTVEHFLSMAIVSLPSGPGRMGERKANIHKSIDLWSVFLGRLEQYELLSKTEVEEYEELMEEMDTTIPMPAPNRDAKIARFKAKQQAKMEMERLKSLRERRSRIGMSAEDEMDGHDEESLERSVALKELSIHKGEAFENWSQSKRELPMIEMMVKMEDERQLMDRHDGSALVQDQRPPLTGKPLKVTHITKDATGTLQLKKEEILSKVFRPGWNQPTMTLEELGDIEYNAAMEREERQKQAEAGKVNEPRRYEELIRDGLEDNTELVDASAQLDRDWDDWKDENPRGSGNKMANRGDKNF
jgi:immunoglobulin-binding protein 1